MKQPEVVAAKLALSEAMNKTGLQRGEIGIFVITQCAAKVTKLKRGNSAKYIDKVLSNKELYFLLLDKMSRLETLEPLSRAGSLGISWGSSTGEAVGLGTENYLSADGIENVMQVLNELEHDKLGNIDFLELYACPSGCVGGSMNIENPFLARTRLRLLRKNYAPVKVEIGSASEFMRSEPYEPLNIYKLDDDRVQAMKKIMRMKAIYDKLPQLDCGACGAPRCMALAEDIVKGCKVRCKYRGEVPDDDG
jgi:iron only hydrogenase large subunit-like protein